LNKSSEEKKNDKLWTTGPVNDGCVPEVFDFKELITWCARRFDPRTRMIKVITKTKNPMVLTPKMFNKMLPLPCANKYFWLVDANAFLAS
jgi:hypothetical protein